MNWRSFGKGGLKVTTIVYNPIAGGLLSGKYAPGAEPPPGTRFALDGIGATYRRRYWDRRYLETTAELKQLAEAHGVSLVTAVVAWTLTNDAVSSAIIGASKLSQLEDHLRATQVELPEGLKERLDRAWYQLPRRPLSSTRHASLTFTLW